MVRGIRPVSVVLVAVLLGVVGIAVARLAREDGRIGPDRRLLNNGRRLEPHGRLTRIGQFPTGGRLTPDGRFLWTVSTGRARNDVRIVSVRTGNVVQVLQLPGASGGIVMDRRRPRAYVSGIRDSTRGDQRSAPGTPGIQGDVVHVFGYDRSTGRAQRAGAKTDLGATLEGGVPDACFANVASIGTDILTGKILFDSVPPPGASAENSSRTACFQRRLFEQLSPDRVPAFNYLTLTNDHTRGLRAGLFDELATPMYDAFTSKPDLAPYRFIPARVPLLETNPSGTRGARASARLPSCLDCASQRELDALLWKSVHGQDAVPPPPGPNASGLDEKRGEEEEDQLEEDREEMVRALKRVTSR